jgi:hypothetical protein
VGSGAWQYLRALGVGEQASAAAACGGVRAPELRVRRTGQRAQHGRDGGCGDGGARGHRKSSSAKVARARSLHSGRAAQRSDGACASGLASPVAAAAALADGNTFQKRSVRSPAPVQIVWPSGDVARKLGVRACAWGRARAG